MKTIKINSYNRKPVLGLIILFIAGLSFLNVGGCIPKSVALQQAFKYRMEGMVDEALLVVDNILVKDSTHALANLEKYRILEYMLVSGVDIDVEMEDAMVYIERAAMYDPDNVVIAYEKALATFLNAYMFMKEGEGDPNEAVEAIIVDFERVLELQPGHPQALLYLVDIYSQLPPNMGGDLEKAKHHAALLKKSDEYYAAKAELLLNPQDELAFWLEYAENHEQTTEVLKEIGTAYIYEEDPENAEKFYREAMELDDKENILLLNLARYYQFLAMTGEAKPDSVFPISAIYIDQYLASEPAPIIPMQAYAMGMKVKVLKFADKKEEGQELKEKAKALDPYYSRAFAIPDQSLFEAPDKINPRYTSFFKPF
jgi:tetratricopeptide (TPR) repeat protein